MAHTTTDRISIQRLQKLHPLIREEAIDLYHDSWRKVAKDGLFIRVTHTSRTAAEQNALYAIGRTTQIGRPVVTFARARESYHDEKWSLALDFALIRGKEALWNTGMDYDADGVPEWLEVVNTYKSAGWEAGIDWKGKKHDPPHLQKTLGYSIAELQELLRQRKFRPDGYLML